MEVEELQSRTIDFLRFPMAVGVILAHCFFPPYDITKLDYSCFTQVDFWGIMRLVLSFTIPCLTAPVFFMISGFLFFKNVDNWNKQVYSQKLQSRFKTLFIPYFFWNILALIFMHGGMWIYLIRGIEDDSWIHSYNNWRWLKSLWCDFSPMMPHAISGAFPLYRPINAPLWFIRDLIVMAICSPLIYFLVKKLKIYFLILLFIAFYTNIWIYTPGFNVLAFLFFSTGAYFSINKLNIVEECRKVQKITYPLFVVLLTLTTLLFGTPTNDFIIPFYALVGVVVFFNLSAYYIEKRNVKANPFIVKSAFFVFVFHWMIIHSIVNLCKDIFHPVLQWEFMICYFASPTLILGCCLLIYYLLRRYVSGFCKFALGSRY